MWRDESLGSTYKIVHSVEDPWQELANAVVMQAVSDYKAALNGHHVHNLSPRLLIKDCERFFTSSWFGVFTTLDGIAVMEHLKKEVKR